MSNIYFRCTLGRVGPGQLRFTYHFRQRWQRTEIRNFKKKIAISGRWERTQCGKQSLAGPPRHKGTQRRVQQTALLAPSSATLSVCNDVEAIPFLKQDFLSEFLEVGERGGWSKFLSEIFVLKNQLRSNIPKIIFWGDKALIPFSGLMRGGYTGEVTFVLVS